MAKFKRRQSINEDITADDFMGKSVATQSSSSTDDITVGLSIEEIQDATKNLTMFKSISSSQLMSVTENNEKRAMLLSHLHQWREQAGWIAGKLLFEIKKRIESDYNGWVSKGEKEEARPQFVDFKRWIEAYAPLMGFGVSAAKQYIWLYQNVEFEKAELGVKKQKLIKQIDDPVKREKLETEAINSKLTVQAIQDRIEKFEKQVQEKEEKEKKIKKIDFDFKIDKGSISINCKKDDAEYIALAIQKYEGQIKLYAQSLKERD